MAENHFPVEVRTSSSFCHEDTPQKYMCLTGVYLGVCCDRWLRHDIHTRCARSRFLSLETLASRHHPASRCSSANGCFAKVVFEDEQAAIKRRKSSMVASMLPDVGDRSEEKIDCMVHQLIQAHRNEYVKAISSEAHGHDHATQSHQDEAQVASALREADPLTRRLDKDPYGFAKGMDKPVQTRLMSKKQLSGMAFGIRELSKRLAHIKLKLKVQNIFILGKAYDDTILHLTRDLARMLLERDEKQRV
jgi:hypothetical protein